MFHRPMTAFSHFCNPQRRRATPAAAKMLWPCRVEDPELFIGEPKATISGWTLIRELILKYLPIRFKLFLKLPAVNSGISALLLQATLMRSLLRFNLHLQGNLWASCRVRRSYLIPKP